MPQDINIAELLSLNEAAEQLCMHRHTLTKKVNEGKIKAYTFEGKYKFTQEAIDDYIKASYIPVKAPEVV